MLSRPIASGLMLLALFAALGGAMWQSDAVEDGAVRLADVEDELPIASAEEPEPERAATAPTRVVDSAGFPAVPDAEPEPVVGPIVTVNGRPLNADRVQPVSQQAEPEQVAVTPAETAPSEGAQIQANVAEPPRPIPRPEGLTGPSVLASTAPQRGTVIDYEAIAAAAYGSDDEFMSIEQRRALAPLPGEAGYRSEYDPRTEGLVQVVGPDGVAIWVYEEQLRSPTNSAVTFQTRRPANQFGFIYDDEGYRW